jgi:hypothetical protein
MAAKWKMPERKPSDGPIGITRAEDGYLIIDCDDTAIKVSEYNAARIFGMLSLFLEIKLPQKLGEAIKLTPDGAQAPMMTVAFPEPQTLGEKLSTALFIEELRAQGQVIEEE